MSEFTMTLAEIRESDPTETFGLGDYPIFDELYREDLNRKIVDHFWNREIGQETLSMFRLAMRRHMNEQMPLFNQLYKSELLKIDPLNTVNITTENESENTGRTESSETNEAKTKVGTASRSVASDTPQSLLADDGDYASSANDTTGQTLTDQDGTGRATSESDSTGKTKNVTTGYSGQQAQLLMLYRETFLNVDMDVINSIEQNGLFMKIWSTGEEYFRNEASYGNFPLYRFPWF